MLVLCLKGGQDLLIEPTIISFLVGKARKGSLKNFEDIELRAWYLLPIAALFQLGLALWNRFGSFSLGTNSFIFLHGLSYFLILICLVLNIKKTYIKLFLIGTALNFLVIFANQGKMPVSLEGIKGIESQEELPLSGLDIKHKKIDEDTKLVYLADIILIDKPYPLPKILSIGDLFLMLGVYSFIQEGMVGKKGKIG